MTKFDELEIPEGVEVAENAYELLRFWVIDEEDAVTISVGMFDEKEPEVWGSILADISRHCVRALCQYYPELDPEVVRGRIENAYMDRLDIEDGTTGSIRGKH